MHNFFAIVKKELTRFFTDKKIVLALILPGILIYLIYSIIGMFMPKIVETTIPEGYTFKIAYINKVVDFDESFNLSVQASGYKYISFDVTDENEAKNLVKSRDYDILVNFEENFEYKIAQYYIHLQDNPRPPKPTVTTYYLSTSDTSVAAAQITSSILDEGYNIKPFTLTNSDMSEQSGTTIKVMAMIFPVLIISLLFSTIMSVAPESIAGEKERQTISSLLITPISRTQLAAGKVFALSLISLVGATFSFLGTALSMPKIMSESYQMGAYYLTAGQYLTLFALIISTVLFLTSLTSIISTYSKSVKEATSIMGAVMPIFMVLSLIAGFLPANSIGLAFIPVYNLSVAVTQIINLNISAPFITITIIMNLVYALGGIFIVMKMFNNEKIMFNR